jgi:hypothetical protein
VTRAVSGVSLGGEKTGSRGGSIRCQERVESRRSTSLPPGIPLGLPMRRSRTRDAANSCSCRSRVWFSPLLRDLQDAPSHVDAKSRRPGIDYAEPVTCRLGCGVSVVRPDFLLELTK